MEFTYLTKRDIGATGAAARSVESEYDRAALMTCPVIRDERRGRFIVFKNRAELLGTYMRMAPSERAWHEVIFGWQAQRLKFDIDAPAHKLAQISPEVIAAGLQAAPGRWAPRPDLDAEVAALFDDANDDVNDDADCKMATPTAATAAVAVMNLLIEAVLAELMSAYSYSGAAEISPSRLDLAVSCSSGPDGVGPDGPRHKYSYHLLVLPYAVSNCSEAQEFTARVIEALPPSVRPLVDAAVNRRTQNFRMELSTKPGTGRMKAASAEVATTFGTACGLGPSDLFVVAGPGARILPEVYSKVQMAPRPAAGALSPAVIDAVLEIAAEAIGAFELSEVRGTLLSFRRRAPSYCRHCSEVHHKDNSLLIAISAADSIDGAADDAPISCRVLERCRQAPGRSTELGTVRITAGELRAADPNRPQRMRNAEKADKGAAERALNSHIAAVRAHLKGEPAHLKGEPAHLKGERAHLKGERARTHDPHAAAASQFEATPEARCTRYSEPAMCDYELVPTLAICAQMKLGKTKALRRYIDRYFPVEGIDPPVIRFVTFRQTFSRALQDAFPDFTLYSDVPAGVALGAVQCPRLIVQVESLHRLPAPRGADATVDLLILDEVESILAQFNSGLHRNFSAAFAMFQWMMANARHVVVMDANLSDRTWAVLASMRPQSPPHFHWNQFQRAAGDQYLFTTDLGAWLARLTVELTAGRRVVIPTNSLAEARAIEADVRSKFPDRAITLYSSEMAPSERARHFAAVHEYWGKLDVLIYTPTCSAGVSFELAHFDVLFGLFTDKSCDVETCRQMLGRVRNLGRREHFICFQASRLASTQHGGLPETIADIRARITDKRCSLFRNEAAGPFAALGFEYDLEGMPGFYETKYFQLWLETTRMENLSKNSFVRRFIDQTADSGADIAGWPRPAGTDGAAAADGAAALVDAATVAENSQLVVAHRAVRTTQRAEQFAAVAAAAELQSDEVEDVRIALSVGADVSADLRRAYEKWHLRAAYDWQGRPIDATFVEKYSASGARRVYRNLGVAVSGATIRESLKRAAAAEAMKYALAMEIRTDRTAAAIEGRDLLRDRSYYTSFGLLLALWMLSACGFEDFLDIRYVHKWELESRLRQLLPVLELQGARALAEFEEIRAADFSRLRREDDPFRFISAVLRFINSILRAAFGAQVSRLPAAAGGDAYYVAWSPVGELFMLTPQGAANANDPRPHIVSMLRPPIADATMVAARALFMDRVYYEEQ